MEEKKNFEKDLLTEKIIGGCYKVHSELGPGFNEKVYHQSLMICLKEAGLNFESEKSFAVYFQTQQVGIL